MRKAFLVVLVFACQGVLAQERPPAQAQPQAPDRTVQGQAAPAPKLGHPLDPRDVEILTGRPQAVAPSGYRVEIPAYWPFSYPINTSRFSQPLFAPLSTATRPPFVPLLFGRVGGRSFILIGSTTSLRVPFFFSLGRSRVVVGPGFVFSRR